VVVNTGDPRWSRPSVTSSALGFDSDPMLAFIGIRALRDEADFCEAYQVKRARAAGHTWAEIATWAGVSAQALHKKHAYGIDHDREPYRSIPLPRPRRRTPKPPSPTLKRAPQHPGDPVDRPAERDVNPPVRLPHDRFDGPGGKPGSSVVTEGQPAG